MANPIKVIISSKQNLQRKYGAQLESVEKLLNDLLTADRKRQLDTRIVFIDDAASAAAIGIKAVKTITRQTAKKAVDDCYKKLRPAYLVIFGAQDVIPFQELKNPVPYDPEEDNDKVVPSDLPYACESGYGRDVSGFTGPSRVLGRIPDIPGKADLAYVKLLIQNIIQHKPLKANKYEDYFAVTAEEWTKSTQETLTNIFGNSTKLKNSPPAKPSYAAEDLKPLIHFYNCHGGPTDSKYYGQKGNNYPDAMVSTDLKGKVSTGTLVAAECCYGAELFNPDNEGNNNLGIANTYLGNKAVAFAGSSTIAYGPASGQGLADLITQYFIKNILLGASTGRAFLEARQQFLSASGPHLDPYELKTLAQFYLLGDPSVQPVLETPQKSGSETIDNRRMNLYNKAVSLQDTAAPAKLMTVEASQKMGLSLSAIKPDQKDMAEVMKASGFTGSETENIFKVTTPNKKITTFAKAMAGSGTIFFRTFTRKKKKTDHRIHFFEVLVLKETSEQILGWKVYHRK